MTSDSIRRLKYAVLGGIAVIVTTVSGIIGLLIYFGRNV